jgi:hypothetical protein
MGNVAAVAGEVSPLCRAVDHARLSLMADASYIRCTDDAGSAELDSLAWGYSRSLVVREQYRSSASNLGNSRTSLGGARKC